MKNNVFGEKYSNSYDFIYKTKNYEAECDFLEAIFNKNKLKVKTILDLGCGTGGHMRIFAKRGYHVTGVDRSSYMLDCARKKMTQENVEGEFIHGDLCSVDLGRKFDVVISMFAVMSYQIKNSDIAAACKTAWKHLNSSGAFIFDGWHGPGVLLDKPVKTTKQVDIGDKQLIRFSDPVLDIISHTVEVRYKLWVIEKDRIISREEESHAVRFFYPQEIAYFLEVAGFSEISFYPFMNLDSKLDGSVWDMTVIGRV